MSLHTVLTTLIAIEINGDRGIDFPELVLKKKKVLETSNTVSLLLGIEPQVFCTELHPQLFYFEIVSR